MTAEGSIDGMDAVAAGNTPTSVTLAADLTPEATQDRIEEAGGDIAPCGRVTGAEAIMTLADTLQPEIAPTTAPEQRARCVWCDQPFTRRMSGGKLQRFCGAGCRRSCETALREWARQEFEAGRITVAELRGAVALRGGGGERDEAA